jgi:hypothetical protein
MTKWMAIVVVPALCALAVGCSSSSHAGEKIIRNNSVAQKFAAFAKQGWTVVGGGIEKNKKPKPIPGTNGMIYSQNPHNAGKNNPLNNAVWTTNFQVDGKKAHGGPGFNMVKADDNVGGLNVVGPKGTALKAANNQGNGMLNVSGPKGSRAKISTPKTGKGGIELMGPNGTGSATISTNNGQLGKGAINVLGPDGKVHTMNQDLGGLGSGSGNLLRPLQSPK